MGEEKLEKRFEDYGSEMRYLPENFSPIRGGEKVPRVPYRSTLADGQSCLGSSAVAIPLPALDLDAPPAKLARW